MSIESNKIPLNFCMSTFKSFNFSINLFLLYFMKMSVFDKI